jgi:PEP-CTERM motif
MKMLFSLKTSLSATAIAFAVAIPNVAQATNFTPGPRVRPCNVGLEPCRLPSPWEVPGKEYSNHFDVDDLQPIPNLDPEQNLAWDGIGGRNNTFDYSGSRSNDPTANREVDALANNGDLYFQEVVTDQVWLLFSTETDNRIFYENPGTATGGVWATPQQIDIDMATIDPQPGLQGSIRPTEMDIDGLEVWGGDGPGNDDADRYSLTGDPLGTSIWAYDAGTNSSSPFVSQVSIFNWVQSLISGNYTENDIDVDGLMTLGDNILFSIAPIDLDGGGITNNAADIDGGEIFYYNDTTGITTFLRHGGHLWDTAFDVMGTYGTATENINALEAVAATPEPGTILGLLTFGAIGGLLRKNRQSK